MKEIPNEVLSLLDDDEVILGYGGEFRVPRNKEQGEWFEGRMLEVSAIKRGWTGYESEILNGEATDAIYCAHMDSDIAKKNRKGHTMTALEWFKRLPNGYRERAIANMTASGKSRVCKKMVEAIRFGVIHWGNTPEGALWWSSIADWSVGERNKLPPLPDKPKDQTAVGDLADMGNFQVKKPSEISYPDQWTPLSEAKPTQVHADALGRVMFCRGATVVMMRPEESKGFTHWKPTGITELPKDPIDEAFEKKWEKVRNKTGRHKSECKEAFRWGWEARAQD